MGLYVGNSKVKINLNGEKYRVNLYASFPITDNVALMSSDGYYLKDSQGKYIVAKDGE